MSSKAKKLKTISAERPKSLRHLIQSSPASALGDLRENGYCWLSRAVPSELCERCASLIQEDVGKRLDKGSPHQEEPIERLDEETVEVMIELRNYLLEKVLKETMDVDAVVPEAWTETLYGRVKRKHFHTKWHCDAFNTLFQRELLRKENLMSGAVINPNWERVRKSGKISGDWSEVPIFTFWVALRPVETKDVSHLRIMPRSHRLPNIQLREELKNVVPEGFKYSPKHFLGPAFPKGYEVGDIVIFHCLTQHEANSHQRKDGSGDKRSGERISMDGRFFLQI